MVYVYNYNRMYMCVCVCSFAREDAVVLFGGLVIQRLGVRHGTLKPSSPCLVDQIKDLVPVATRPQSLDLVGRVLRVLEYSGACNRFPGTFGWISGFPANLYPKCKA